MATYTVVHGVDRTGFHVAIQGSDGIRQTILGFETRVEAEAWIDHDKPECRSSGPAVNRLTLVDGTIMVIKHHSPRDPSHCGRCSVTPSPAR